MQSRLIGVDRLKREEPQTTKPHEKPIEPIEHELELMERDSKIYRNWTDLQNRVTKGKAIRLKCLDCCCGVANEIKLCHTLTCPLWPYRMGREDRTWHPWPGEDPDMRGSLSSLAK